MSILYLLIPLAVIIMGIAVAFFIWTVRSGQYDDLEGPAYRILMDDDDPMIPGKRRTGEGRREPGEGAAGKEDTDKGRADDD
jgi:cbb3-type cytochrome oxidase maturation protein